MFNRKYVFSKGSIFQIQVAILVYSTVFVTKKQASFWRLGHLEFQMVEFVQPYPSSIQHSWILMFHVFQTVSWRLEVWFNDMVTCLSRGTGDDESMLLSAASLNVRYPWYCWWFRNPKQPPGNPVNNGINYLIYLSTGAGFLPSTILLMVQKSN